MKRVKSRMNLEAMHKEVVTNANYIVADTSLKQKNNYVE